MTHLSSLRIPLRNFFELINSFSANIKFTFEKEDEHSELLFLDCFVKRNPSGNLNLTIYMKGKVEGKDNIINNLRSDNCPINTIKNILNRNYPSINDRFNGRFFIGTVYLPYRQGAIGELRMILKTQNRSFL